MFRIHRSVPISSFEVAQWPLVEKLSAGGWIRKCKDAWRRRHIVHVDIAGGLREIRLTNALLVDVCQVRHHGLGVQDVRPGDGLVYVDPGKLTEELKQVGDIHHAGYFAS